MDFERLYQIIPKDPIRWNIEDVGKWLNFIGLPHYDKNFRDNTIDGACLSYISDEDLQNDLGVKSNIIRKKLLNWFQVGIKQYSLYLKNEAGEQQQNQNQITYADIPFNFEATNVSKGNSNIENEENIYDMMTGNVKFPNEQIEIEKNTNNMVEIQNNQNLNRQILQDNSSYLNIQSQNKQQNQIYPQKMEIKQNKKEYQRKNTIHKQIQQYPPQNQQMIEEEEEITMQPMGHQKYPLQLQRQNTTQQQQVYDNIVITNNNNFKNDNCEIIENKIIEEGNIDRNRIMKFEEDNTVTNTDVQQGSQNIKQNKNNIKNKLIIQPSDGPQTNFYCIDENGGKIGRHSSNNILILEESISRYHAEIKFIPETGSFAIQDIKSTTGTFIKITDSLQLKPGQLLEMGSNQFIVESAKAEGIKQGELVLKVFEGTNLNKIYNLKFDKQNEKYGFGRKNNNEIPLPDDHHLSNQHCRFFMNGSLFYVEDLSSTNGTWLRISMEGEESELYPLQDKSVFKIGTTSTYQCKINKDAIVSEDDKTLGDLCVICCENEKDALYMPCKHNTACVKCTKSLKVCPICRNQIEDFIKIYKA
ncbi:Sterile alpha motif/pointed domain [Pseudocohnilembus persalinus]|uniref:Sterile alpha motif/pointed domain n=1 Tax=Pseudocohnilembus persalinus TaxID=266149 RepID=A0A0V0QJY3_PSEPJ|nr:Sterile alpha motif/pointed domain [Pseudocohnilembus persalinus]|eukprot:KRX02394.1 Sterile alpha motif/pointed domain [Pseudocohnilembus persalinus]